MSVRRPVEALHVFALSLHQLRQFTDLAGNDVEEGKLAKDKASLELQICDMYTHDEKEKLGDSITTRSQEGSKQ